MADLEAALPPPWRKLFWELKRKSLVMENKKTRWVLGHFTKPPSAPAELETVHTHNQRYTEICPPFPSSLPSLDSKNPGSQTRILLGTVYELCFEQSQQPKSKVLNLLTSKVWPDHSIVKSKWTHSGLPTSFLDSNCLSGEAKQPRISKHLRKVSNM